MLCPEGARELSPGFTGNSAKMFRPEGAGGYHRYRPGAIASLSNHHQKGESAFSELKSNSEFM